MYLNVHGGTRWRSWLTHCATSRKVAGSIPDVVTGIFHWHNPSGSSMALGLTQPLTEMSTRNISWGRWSSRPMHKSHNHTTFMCRMSWNLGASISWNSQVLSRPVMGLLYLYVKGSGSHLIRRHLPAINDVSTETRWGWPVLGPVCGDGVGGVRSSMRPIVY